MEKENQDSTSVNTKKYTIIFYFIIAVILITFYFTCLRGYSKIIKEKMKPKDFCDCIISEDFDTIRKQNGGKVHCSELHNCSCGSCYTFCTDFLIHPYTGAVEYLYSGKVIRTVQYEKGIAKQYCGKQTHGKNPGMIHWFRFRIIFYYFTNKL